MLSIKINRRLWLWLIPLLLATTWLGARGLNADAFWHDEVWTLWDVGGGHFEPRSSIDVWNGMAERKVDNLPGYYLILNTWGKLSGWSEFSTRVLSLFFGLLAIAWTYRLGRDLLNYRVGLAAALILGTSAFFVNYLHELRGYTMTAALTAFTVWAYSRLMLERRKAAPVLQIGFVAGIAGLMYAHYFAILGVVALGVYHVLFGANRFSRRWWHVLGLMTIGGLTFVAWLFSGAIGGALNRIENDERLHSLAMSAPEATERVMYYFANGSYLLLLVTAVGVALAMWRWRRARLIGFMALAILALGLLVNVRMELLEKGRIRYLIGLWPLLSLLAAVGLSFLAGDFNPPFGTNLLPLRVRGGLGRGLFTAILTIWVIAGVVNVFNPAFVHDLDGSQQENDWKTLFDVLYADVQAGDAVAFDAPIFTWVPHRVFTYYAETLPARWTLMDSLPGEQSDDEYFEQAQTFIDSANDGNGAMRVWLGADTREDSSFRLGEFERALQADDFATCGPIIDTDDMTLDLYAVIPECCFAPENIAASPYRYGDGINITHVEAIAPDADQSLPVLLAWSVADTVPDNTYSVALHVLDANGELAAQADYGLPMESFTCRAATIPLDNLPPGDYSLVSIVYDWQSGARLTGEAAESGEHNERLTLGTFTVAP